MSQLTCARRCLTGHQIIFKKISWLSVEPILADYTKEVKWKVDDSRRRLFIFLGGTIGNFDANLALQS